MVGLSPRPWVLALKSENLPFAESLKAPKGNGIQDQACEIFFRQPVQAALEEKAQQGI